jgi:hypothetical protein
MGDRQMAMWSSAMGNGQWRIVNGQFEMVAHWQSAIANGLCPWPIAHGDIAYYPSAIAHGPRA